MNINKALLTLMRQLLFPLVSFARDSACFTKTTIAFTALSTLHFVNLSLQISVGILC